MTVIPSYPDLPMEDVYPRAAKTDEPAVYLTNAMMMKGPIREVIPLAGQKLRFTLPSGATAKRVHLLVSNAECVPRTRGRDIELDLLHALANRHGLITGATGTGKTVSLQVIAERLSEIGVPVFMADVKGYLAGMSQPGGGNPKILDRARKLGLTLTPQAAPVVFWDVFKQQGHPARATISEMGPLLLSRMLGGATPPDDPPEQQQPEQHCADHPRIQPEWLRRLQQSQVIDQLRGWIHGCNRR